MNKKLFLVLFFLVTMVDIVSAATISGNIYDISLSRVDSALVEIDTVPKQKYVVTDGSYSFTLDPGSYRLKAVSPELQALAEETVIISQEGDFIVDLILFPSLDDNLITDPGVGVDLDTSSRVSIVILSIILVLAIVGVFILFKIYQKVIEKLEDRKSEPNEPVKPVDEIIPVVKEEEKKEFNEDLQDVIDIIKKAGGRITQKDIRKQNPLSEAKISLIIAELEEKGIVKKIKKGRGNIIILEEK